MFSCFLKGKLSLVAIFPQVSLCYEITDPSQLQDELIKQSMARITPQYLQYTYLSNSFFPVLCELFTTFCSFVCFESFCLFSLETFAFLGKCALDLHICEIHTYKES